MAEQRQNETTTIPRKNAIDNDYDLSRNLGLFNPINGHIIMLDSLKRKAPSPNGDVIRNEQGASERRRKVMNSGLIPRSFQGQNGNLVGNNGGGGGGETRSSVSTGSSSDTYHGENSSDTSSQSSHSRGHLPAATAPASDPSENQPVSSQEETHLNYSNQSQCSRNVTLTDFNRQPRKSQSDSNKRALDEGSSPTPPRSSSLKEPKVVIGKPPKPKRQMSQQSVLLPQMPCVSTDGPNGKTITGFLFKYSKTEVSIICVCHGASFSPAGFVEHAGGVDVEHPLKHIRVVPFALS